MSVRAVDRSFATTDWAISWSGRPDCCTCSHHSAVTPATWGVAMLVPLSSLSPPPTLAERIPTPGPETTGKVFENGAMSKRSPDRPRAPTETTPSAAAGSDAAIS